MKDRRERRQMKLKTVLWRQELFSENKKENIYVIVTPTVA